MSITPFQVMPALDAATEAALRSSIERFGVLVPVVRDQHGRTIDGHHRSRIADELGVAYPSDTVQVDDDDQAREIARTLNSDRRHLTIEQRREVVADLRSQGHSQRATAKALGVALDTVQRDEHQLTDAGQLTVPERTIGLDGKSRPSTRPSVLALASVDPDYDRDAAANPIPPSVSDGSWDQVERVRESIEAKYAPERAVRDAMTGLTRAIQKIVDADPSAAEYLARLDMRERPSFAKDCGHALHFITSAVRVLEDWRDASSKPSKLEAVR